MVGDGVLHSSHPMESHDPKKSIPGDDFLSWLLLFLDDLQVLIAGIVCLDRPAGLDYLP